MKDILRQYIKIIGNSLIGLAFGFAFFYLFLNIYHYQEIRREVYIDFKNDSSLALLNQTLENVDNNIQSLPSSSNYHGTINYGDAVLWQTRLQACVNSFRNSGVKEIQTKETLNIKDIYEFRNSFENDVLNDCIVTHLYGLVGENTVKHPFIQENQKLLKYYMDDLLQDTSYLKKDLYANSNYYFTTDIVALSVKNDVKDGYYEVMASYNKAAKFLEIISDWYKDGVGGAV